MGTYKYNTLVKLDYTGRGKRFSVRSKSVDWILLDQTTLEIEKKKVPCGLPALSRLTNVVNTLKISKDSQFLDFCSH